MIFVSRMRKLAGLVLWWAWALAALQFRLLPQLALHTRLVVIEFKVVKWVLILGAVIDLIRFLLSSLS